MELPKFMDNMGLIDKLINISTFFEDKFLLNLEFIIINLISFNNILRRSHLQRSCHLHRLGVSVPLHHWAHGQKPWVLLRPSCNASRNLAMNLTLGYMKLPLLHWTRCHWPWSQNLGALCRQTWTHHLGWSWDSNHSHPLTEYLLLRLRVHHLISWVISLKRYWLRSWEHLPQWLLLLQNLTLRLNF